MTSLKDTIIHKLKDNKLAMIPRWQFVLYSTLGIFSLVFIFLALVFMLSLGIFVLARHGLIFLPFFGFAYIFNLLKTVPLFLTFVMVVLLIAAEFLVKQYAWAFRKSFVSILLTITLVVALSSFLVACTPLHHDIEVYAHDHDVPFFNHSYDRPFPPREEHDITVLRGTANNVATDTFEILLPENDMIMIFASSTTFDDNEIPHNGDDIIVFGKFEGDVFEAFHVRPATDFPFPLYH